LGVFVCEIDGPLGCPSGKFQKVRNENSGELEENRKVCEIEQKRYMTWVDAPVSTTDFVVFVNDAATLKAVNSYQPGKLLNIGVETMSYDKRVSGFMLYAVDSQNIKVGEWEFVSGKKNKYIIIFYLDCSRYFDFCFILF
jgi:hypothetical protein